MAITPGKLAALEPIVQDPDVVVKKVGSLLEKQVSVISFKLLVLASTSCPRLICTISVLMHASIVSPQLTRITSVLIYSWFGQKLHALQVQLTIQNDGPVTASMFQT